MIIYLSRVIKMPMFVLRGKHRHLNVAGSLCVIWRIFAEESTFPVMNNTFQVELIEFKANFQHQMDLLEGMLNAEQSGLPERAINLDNITLARRELVLQAINRFEGICEKHGADPEDSIY